MSKQSDLRAEPTASRPHIPGYGVPESDEGLLPWSHVTARLEQARNYWVGTVDKDGQPHAVPVWGVWVDGALYFGGGPRTNRNLQANPKVVVHLESGDDVVIVEGVAEEFTDLEPAVFARFADASAAKYNYRPEEAGGYVLRPRVVYAWTKFPQDATRWRFDND
jgi:nitroimidazol reductase NimA-like FMN-containing flavoprotein (pyridoxamine 5'-phosphate oxidase superfamily)